MSLCWSVCLSPLDVQTLFLTCDVDPLYTCHSHAPTVYTALQEPQMGNFNFWDIFIMKQKVETFPASRSQHPVVTTEINFPKDARCLLWTFKGNTSHQLPTPVLVFRFTSDKGPSEGETGKSPFENKISTLSQGYPQEIVKSSKVLKRLLLWGQWAWNSPLPP